VWELRANLLAIGLKTGVPGLSFKPKEPIENVTTFKPFSINELQVDIFGEKENRVQNIIRNYEERGMKRNPSAARS